MFNYFAAALPLYKDVVATVQDSIDSLQSSIDKSTSMSTLNIASILGIITSGAEKLAEDFFGVSGADTNLINEIVSPPIMSRSKSKSKTSA